MLKSVSSVNVFTATFINFPSLRYIEGMKKLLIALILPLMVGCASSYINEQQQPGYIGETHSIEGVREVSLTPSWLYNSSTMIVGAWWNETMGDKIMLQVATPSAESFSRNPLKIIIDGDVTWVNPSSNYFGTIETLQFGHHISFRSHQNYPIDRALLDKMLSADKVLLRADLLETYIDGQLSPVVENQNQYPQMMALGKLKEFVGRID